MTYHRAFSMALGGGEYERQDTFAPGADVTSVVGGKRLQAALERVRRGGIVEIGDNGRYSATTTR